MNMLQAVRSAGVQQWRRKPDYREKMYGSNEGLYLETWKFGSSLQVCCNPCLASLGAQLAQHYTRAR